MERRYNMRVAGILGCILMSSSIRGKIWYINRARGSIAKTTHLPHFRRSDPDYINKATAIILSVREPAGRHCDLVDHGQLCLARPKSFDFPGMLRTALDRAKRQAATRRLQ